MIWLVVGAVAGWCAAAVVFGMALGRVLRARRGLDEAALTACIAAHPAGKRRTR